MVEVLVEVLKEVLDGRGSGTCVLVRLEVSEAVVVELASPSILDDRF